MTKIALILALAIGGILLQSCQSIWGFRGFEAGGAGPEGSGDGEAGAPSGGAADVCSDCGACERCVDGSCIADCGAGGASCVGAVRCSCAEQGRAAEEVCASEALCARSLAMGLEGCAAPQCQLNERRCVSTPVETRAEVCPESLIWEQRRECTDKAAQCISGSCTLLDVDATEVSVLEYSDFVAELGASISEKFEFEDDHFGNFCKGTSVGALEEECLQEAPCGECQLCRTKQEGDCVDECSACDAAPQTCISWCQAAAYCQTQGRRLCGSVGRESETSVGLSLTDALTEHSAWSLACAGGLLLDSSVFGTGSELAEDCIWGGRWTFGASSGGNCHPINAGYAQFYDFSGGVAEWEDSCDKWTPVNSSCRVRGGSFMALNEPDLSCLANRLEDPTEGYPDVGFRCCGP